MIVHRHATRAGSRTTFGPQLVPAIIDSEVANALQVAAATGTAVPVLGCSDMNWRQFFATLITAFMWPATVIVIALLFRTKITELLGDRLQRFKAGPIEAEWDWVASETRNAVEHVEQIEQQPEETAEGTPPSETHKTPEVATDWRPLELAWSLVKTAPRLAVAEGATAVEQRLVRRFRETGVELPEGSGLRRLAMVARREGLVARELAHAIAGLGELRNIAVHERDREIYRDQARDYLTLAQTVLDLMGPPHPTLLEALGYPDPDIARR